jgi:ABC-type lipoprotein export system ATPase subunit
MEQYKDYLPTILSGGEQQRVSMARALVASPKLIIADEPTGDLDSKNGQMIINLLLYFQHELKRTIMLVTHNLEYLALSNTQLHILDGKVAVVRPGYRLPANVIDSLKLQIAALTKMGGQT